MRKGLSIYLIYLRILPTPSRAFLAGSVRHVVGKKDDRKRDSEMIKR